MKFQYISDLHLEFGNKMNIIPVAEYLILAGDICQLNCKTKYKDFLNRISKKFKLIFIVSGNHEYYGQTIESGDAFLSTLSKTFNNVIYLNNEIYHFDNSDISILGTTLWSYIAQEEYSIIKKYMNDYRLIKNFTPLLSSEMFKNNCEFVEDSLKNHTNKKFIVVCHHVPQKRLIDSKYSGDPLNSAFASDLPILDSSQVLACVYGHTHIPSISGKYYCNSFGYPRENKHEDINKYFEI